MTDRSPIQRALLTIRQLKARIAELEKGGVGPIAVVGMAVRLPGGACDPEGLWQRLSTPAHAFGPVPSDRWNPSDFPELPPVGAFLEGPVDGIDRAFWGISPREAAEVDPQQRLLLELAWEALEHAQIPTDQVRGTPAGVYVGCTGSDWAGLRRGYAELSEYSGTGTTGSLLANRISYHFDLRGPSLTLDAACSSSLVSVHAAMQDLRAGTVDLALAGGVTLMLDPAPALIFARTGVLAPDGRCRPFDATSEGFGRGEGAVMLALMRLEDAVERGLPMLAALHGSAVGQDGRGPGLTVPRAAGHAEVARRALADAQATPAEVGFIEAHAAGSTLGDPIEVGALAEVYRRDSPGFIGSVKGHIGHLEGACGIASLAKAIVAVAHGEVPPQAGLERLSPTIELDGTGLEIACERQPWPAEAPLAAVHSYGYGGTNAHVILGPAPAVEAETHPRRLGVVVSARDDAALVVLAQALADRVEAGVDAADLCASWGSGRAQLARTVTVEAEDTAALIVALRAVTGPDDAPAPDWSWSSVRRVPLPAYPWQRQRLRSRPVPGCAEAPVRASTAGGAWHPGPPEGRTERVTARVCARAAEVLGFEAPVDSTRPLAEHGFDSMMSIKLVNCLAQDGLVVAVHAVMGGPSPLEIASQVQAATGSQGIDPTSIPEIWMPRNLALSHAVAFVVGAALAALATGIILQVVW